MEAKKIIIKIISVIVLVCFILNDFAWAYPDYRQPNIATVVQQTLFSASDPESFSRAAASYLGLLMSQRFKDMSLAGVQETIEEIHRNASTKLQFEGIKFDVKSKAEQGQVFIYISGKCILRYFNSKMPGLTIPAGFKPIETETQLLNDYLSLQILIPITESATPGVAEASDINLLTSGIESSDLEAAMSSKTPQEIRELAITVIQHIVNQVMVNPNETKDANIIRIERRGIRKALDEPLRSLYNENTLWQILPSEVNNLAFEGMPAIDTKLWESGRSLTIKERKALDAFLEEIRPLLLSEIVSPLVRIDIALDGISELSDEEKCPRVKEITANWEKLRKAMEFIIPIEPIANIHFDKIWNALQEELKSDKKVSLERIRDYIISQTIKKSILRKIASWMMENLGERPTLRTILFLILPIVKWLQEKFLIPTSGRAKLAIAQAEKAILEKRKHGIAVTLDSVGDSALTEKEAEMHVFHYLDMMESLSEKHFAVKLSAIVCKAWEQDDGVFINKQKVKDALKILVRRAAETGSFICIDPEEYAYRDFITEVYKEVIEELAKENRSIVVSDKDGTLRIGLGVQAYLKDSGKALFELFTWATENNYRLPIRLVKGAYEKKEKKWAREGVGPDDVTLNGGKPYPSPVFDKKESTDAHFELLTEFLIKNNNRFSIAIASHNIRSLAKTMALAEYYALPKERIEFQMLYGMGEPIQRVIAEMGYHIRAYVPIGSFTRGMKYSGRRLDELADNDNALVRTMASDYEFLKTLRNSPKFQQDDLPSFITQPLIGRASAVSVSPVKKEYSIDEPFIERRRSDTENKVQRSLIGTLQHVFNNLCSSAALVEYMVEDIEKDKAYKKQDVEFLKDAVGEMTVCVRRLHQPDRWKWFKGSAPDLAFEGMAAARGEEWKKGVLVSREEGEAVVRFADKFKDEFLRIETYAKTIARKTREVEKLDCREESAKAIALLNEISGELDSLNKTVKGIVAKIRRLHLIRELMAAKEETERLKLAYEHELSLDMRPVNARLLDIGFVGHDMAVKNIVNPDETVEKVALYGGAGADFSNFLLSTNARKAFFVDLTHVDAEELERLLNHGHLWNILDGNFLKKLWDDSIAENQLKDKCSESLIRRLKQLHVYANAKYNHGFGGSQGEGMADIELRILLELKSMGVTKESIKINDDPVNNSLEISFDWQYPGCEKGRYSITYIHTDLTRPRRYPQVLRKILEQGIDIYYQRASRLLAEEYGKFLNIIASSIRPNGYLVTDDYIHLKGYKDPDPILARLKAFSYTKKGEVSSDEVKLWLSLIKRQLRLKLKLSGEALKKGDFGYGWDMAIRQRKEIAASSRGSIFSWTWAVLKRIGSVGACIVLSAEYVLGADYSREKLLETGSQISGPEIAVIALVAIILVAWISWHVVTAHRKKLRWLQEHRSRAPELTPVVSITPRVLPVVSTATQPPATLKTDIKEDEKKRKREEAAAVQKEWQETYARLKKVADASDKIIIALARLYKLLGDIGPKVNDKEAELRAWAAQVSREAKEKLDKPYFKPHERQSLQALVNAANEFERMIRPDPQIYTNAQQAVSKARNTLVTQKARMREIIKRVLETKRLEDGQKQALKDAYSILIAEKKSIASLLRTIAQRGQNIIEARKKIKTAKANADKIPQGPRVEKATDTSAIDGLIREIERDYQEGTGEAVRPSLAPQPKYSTEEERTIFQRLIMTSCLQEILPEFRTKFKIGDELGGDITSDLDDGKVMKDRKIQIAQEIRKEFMKALSTGTVAQFFRTEIFKLYLSLTKTPSNESKWERTFRNNTGEELSHWCEREFDPALKILNNSYREKSGRTLEDDKLLEAVKKLLECIDMDLSLEAVIVAENSIESGPSFGDSDSSSDGESYGNGGTPSFLVLIPFMLTFVGALAGAVAGSLVINALVDSGQGYMVCPLIGALAVRGLINKRQYSSKTVLGYPGITEGGRQELERINNDKGTSYSSGARFEIINEKDDPAGIFKYIKTAIENGPYSDLANLFKAIKIVDLSSAISWGKDEYCFGIGGFGAIKRVYVTWERDGTIVFTRKFFEEAQEKTPNILVQAVVGQLVYATGGTVTIAESAELAYTPRDKAPRRIGFPISNLDEFIIDHIELRCNRGYRLSKTLRYILWREAVGFVRFDTWELGFQPPRLNDKPQGLVDVVSKPLPKPAPRPATSLPKPLPRPETPPPFSIVRGERWERLEVAFIKGEFKINREELLFVWPQVKVTRGLSFTRIFTLPTIHLKWPRFLQKFIPSPRGEATIEEAAPEPLPDLAAKWKELLDTATGKRDAQEKQKVSLIILTNAEKTGRVSKESLQNAVTALIEERGRLARRILEELKTEKDWNKILARLNELAGEIRRLIEELKDIYNELGVMCDEVERDDLRVSERADKLLVVTRENLETTKKAKESFQILSILGGLAQTIENLESRAKAGRYIYADVPITIKKGKFNIKAQTKNAYEALSPAVLDQGLLTSFLNLESVYNALLSQWATDNVKLWLVERRKKDVKKREEDIEQARRRAVERLRGIRGFDDTGVAHTKIAPEEGMGVARETLIHEEEEKKEPTREDLEKLEREIKGLREGEGSLLSREIQEQIEIIEGSSEARRKTPAPDQALIKRDIMRRYLEDFLPLFQGFVIPTSWGFTIKLDMELCRSLVKRDLSKERPVNEKDIEDKAKKVFELVRTLRTYSNQYFDEQTDIVETLLWILLSKCNNAPIDTEDELKKRMGIQKILAQDLYFVVLKEALERGREKKEGGITHNEFQELLEQFALITKKDRIPEENDRIQRRVIDGEIKTAALERVKELRLAQFYDRFNLTRHDKEIVKIVREYLELAIRYKDTPFTRDTFRFLITQADKTRWDKAFKGNSDITGEDMRAWCETELVPALKVLQDRYGQKTRKILEGKALLIAIITLLSRREQLLTELAPSIADAIIAKETKQSPLRGSSNGIKLISFFIAALLLATIPSPAWALETGKTTYTIPGMSAGVSVIFASSYFWAAVVGAIIFALALYYYRRGIVEFARSKLPSWLARGIEALLFYHLIPPAKTKGISNRLKKASEKPATIIGVFIGLIIFLSIELLDWAKQTFLEIIKSKKGFKDKPPRSRCKRNGGYTILGLVLLVASAALAIAPVAYSANLEGILIGFTIAAISGGAVIGIGRFRTKSQSIKLLLEQLKPLQASYYSTSPSFGWIAVPATSIRSAANAITNLIQEAILKISLVPIAPTSRRNKWDNVLDTYRLREFVQNVFVNIESTIAYFLNPVNVMVFCFAGGSGGGGIQVPGNPPNEPGAPQNDEPGIPSDEPKKRIAVVALGGNAFDDLPLMAKAIVDLVEGGYEVVVTHGNGPQVGKLLKDSPHVSLPTLVMVTQAQMGSQLKKEIEKELEIRRIKKEIDSWITYVQVDPDDLAFKDPTKPIGEKFKTRAEAEKAAKIMGGLPVKEETGGKFRPVVASPIPKSVLNFTSIKKSLEKGNIVIAVGGGGIPVSRGPGGVTKEEVGVIDKDRASGLLARQLNADLFVILTGVPQVFVNLGKKNQKGFTFMSLGQARRYMKEGQFPDGNMGPKVEAVIDFVNETSNPAIITDAANLNDALKGEAGTHIFGTVVDAVKNYVNVIEDFINTLHSTPEAMIRLSQARNIAAFSEFYSRVFPKLVSTEESMAHLKMASLVLSLGENPNESMEIFRDIVKERELAIPSQTLEIVEEVVTNYNEADKIKDKTTRLLAQILFASVLSSAYYEKTPHPRIEGLYQDLARKPSSGTNQSLFRIERRMRRYLRSSARRGSPRFTALILGIYLGPEAYNVWQMIESQGGIKLRARGKETSRLRGPPWTWSRENLERLLQRIENREARERLIKKILGAKDRDKGLPAIDRMIILAEDILAELSANDLSPKQAMAILALIFYPLRPETIFSYEAPIDPTGLFQIGEYTTVKMPDDQTISQMNDEERERFDRLVEVLNKAARGEITLAKAVDELARGENSLSPILEASVLLESLFNPYRIDAAPYQYINLIKSSGDFQALATIGERVRRLVDNFAGKEDLKEKHDLLKRLYNQIYVLLLLRDALPKVSTGKTLMIMLRPNDREIARVIFGWMLRHVGKTVEIFRDIEIVKAIFGCQDPTVTNSAKLLKWLLKELKTNVFCLVISDEEGRIFVGRIIRLLATLFIPIIGIAWTLSTGDPQGVQVAATGALFGGLIPNPEIGKGKKYKNPILDFVWIRDPERGLIEEQVGCKGRFVVQDRTKEKGLPNEAFMRVIKSISITMEELNKPFDRVNLTIVDSLDEKDFIISVSEDPSRPIEIVVKKDFLFVDRFKQREAFSAVIASLDEVKAKQSQAQEIASVPLTSFGVPRNDDITTNLLFLSVDQESEFEGIEPSIPAWAFYLASSVKKAYSNFGRPNRAKVDFKFLNEYFEKDESQREEEVRRLVEGRHIIALTVYEGTFEAVRDIARIARKYNPSAFIALGGHVVTVLPEQMASFIPEANILVRGEAEKVFPEVIMALEGLSAQEELTNETIERLENISRGLIVRVKDTFLSNGTDDVNIIFDMDSIELDFTLLNKDQINSSYRFLNTGRGCPFKCVFCTRTHGNVFRPMSAKRMIEHLRNYLAYLEELGIPNDSKGRWIYIPDDDILLDPDRAIEFFEAFEKEFKRKLYLIARQASINSFFLRNKDGEYIKIDGKRQLNHRLIDALTKGEIFVDGIARISLGTDGFNDEELLRLIKGYNMEEVEMVVKELDKRGIRGVHYWIMSTPDTTLVDWVRSFLNVRRLERRHETTFFVPRVNAGLMPSPGSILYYNLARKGRLDAGERTIKTEKIAAVSGFQEFDHIFAGSIFPSFPFNMPEAQGAPYVTTGKSLINSTALFAESGFGSIKIKQMLIFIEVLRIFAFMSIINRYNYLTSQGGESYLEAKRFEEEIKEVVEFGGISWLYNDAIESIQTLIDVLALDLKEGLKEGLAAKQPYEDNLGTYIRALRGLRLLFLEYPALKVIDRDIKARLSRFVTQKGLSSKIRDELSKLINPNMVEDEALWKSIFPEGSIPTPSKKIDSSRPMVKFTWIRNKHDKDVSNEAVAAVMKSFAASMDEEGHSVGRVNLTILDELDEYKYKEVIKRGKEIITARFEYFIITLHEDNALPIELAVKKNFLRLDHPKQCEIFRQAFKDMPRRLPPLIPTSDVLTPEVQTSEVRIAVDFSSTKRLDLGEGRLNILLPNRTAAPQLTDVELYKLLFNEDQGKAEEDFRKVHGNRFEQLTIADIDAIEDVLRRLPQDARWVAERYSYSSKNRKANLGVLRRPFKTARKKEQIDRIMDSGRQAFFILLPEALRTKLEAEYQAIEKEVGSCKYEISWPGIPYGPAFTTFLYRLAEKSRTLRKRERIKRILQIVRRYFINGENLEKIAKLSGISKSELLSTLKPYSQHLCHLLPRERIRTMLEDGVADIFVVKLDTRAIICAPDKFKELLDSADRGTARELCRNTELVQVDAGQKTITLSREFFRDFNEVRSFVLVERPEKRLIELHPRPVSTSTADILKLEVPWHKIWEDYLTSFGSSPPEHYQRFNDLIELARHPERWANNFEESWERGFVQEISSLSAQELAEKFLEYYPEDGRSHKDLRQVTRIRPIETRDIRIPDLTDIYIQFLMAIMLDKRANYRDAKQQIWMLREWIYRHWDASPKLRSYEVMQRAGGTKGGHIAQGEEAFRQMVLNIRDGGFAEDVTDNAQIKSDVRAIKERLERSKVEGGWWKGPLRIVSTNEVVLSDTDFSFGFYSHAPPVQKKLIEILGSEQEFYRVFPRPTIVLSEKFLSHPNASIRQEAILHEAICYSVGYFKARELLSSARRVNLETLRDLLGSERLEDKCVELGHYLAIFEAQKYFPENYRDGEYESNRDGRKFLTGYLNVPRKPFKGEVGRFIRETIDEKMGTVPSEASGLSPFSQRFELLPSRPELLRLSCAEKDYKYPVAKDREGNIWIVKDRDDAVSLFKEERLVSLIAPDVVAPVVVLDSANCTNQAFLEKMSKGGVNNLILSKTRSKIRSDGTLIVPVEVRHSKEGFYKVIPIIKRDGSIDEVWSNIEKLPGAAIVNGALERLFVLCVLVREADTHYSNMKYYQGEDGEIIPISYDHGQALFLKGKDKWADIRNFTDVFYRIGEADYLPQAYLKADRYTYTRKFLDEKMLDPRKIDDAIREFQALTNETLESYCKEAGYTGEELRLVTEWLKANRDNLKKDVEYLLAYGQRVLLIINEAETLYNEAANIICTSGDYMNNYTRGIDLVKRIAVGARILEEEYGESVRGLIAVELTDRAITALKQILYQLETKIDRATIEQELESLRSSVEKLKAMISNEFGNGPFNYEGRISKLIGDFDEWLGRIDGKISAKKPGKRETPKGTPASLLRYMHENRIFKGNAKRSVQMARKRGGNDSLRTIQRELRVLRDVDLVECYGRGHYYLAEWLRDKNIEDVIRENPGLELPNPSRDGSQINPTPVPEINLTPVPDAMENAKQLIPTTVAATATSGVATLEVEVAERQASLEVYWEDLGLAYNRAIHDGNVQNREIAEEIVNLLALSFQPDLWEEYFKEEWEEDFVCEISALSQKELRTRFIDQFPETGRQNKDLAEIRTIASSAPSDASLESIYLCLLARPGEVSTKRAIWILREWIYRHGDKSSKKRSYLLAKWKTELLRRDLLTWHAPLKEEFPPNLASLVWDRDKLVSAYIDLDLFLGRTLGKEYDAERRVITRKFLLAAAIPIFKDEHPYIMNPAVIESLSKLLLVDLSLEADREHMITRCEEIRGIFLNLRVSYISYKKLIREIIKLLKYVDDVITKNKKADVRPVQESIQRMRFLGSILRKARRSLRGDDRQPPTGDKRRSKGEIAEGFETILGDMWLRNGLFTSAHFQEKRRYGYTTTSNELIGMVKLGILEIDKSKRPYVYRLVNEYRRAPPLVLEKVQSILKKLPAQPDDDTLEATKTLLFEKLRRRYPNIYEVNTRALGKRFGEIRDKELMEWKACGAQVIWFMGAWKESDYSRRLNKFHDERREASAYAIPEYEINKNLGGEEEFRDLVKRANVLGLKVMLDIVPNHMAADTQLAVEHPEFFMRPPSELIEMGFLQPRSRLEPVKLAKGERHSPLFQHPETGQVFYYGNPDPMNSAGIPWVDTIQFNWANPDMREFMKEMILKAADLTNGGGIRFDMVFLAFSENIRRNWFQGLTDGQCRYIDEFWKDITRELKTEYPGITLLAESYEFTGDRVHELGFDFYYENYFRKLLEAGNMPELEKFLDGINRSGRFNFIKFLENHDISKRIKAVLGKDAVLAAAALLYTLPGASLVYHAQEKGNISWTPDATVVHASNEKDDINTKTFHERLGRITSNDIFRNGSFRLLNTEGSSDNIIAFEREYKGERAIVIVNYSPVSESVAVNTGDKIIETKLAAWGNKILTEDGDEFFGECDIEFATSIHEAALKAEFNLLYKEIREAGQEFLLDTDNGIYHASPLKDLAVVFRELRMKPGQSLVDLGSGDGRVGSLAATMGLETTLIESDSRLVKANRIAQIKFFGTIDFSKTRIIEGDFLDQDLSEYDFVYYYAGGSHGKQALEEKLLRSIKPGAKVVVLGGTLNSLNLVRTIEGLSSGMEVNIYEKPPQRQRDGSETNPAPVPKSNPTPVPTRGGAGKLESGSFKVEDVKRTIHTTINALVTAGYRICRKTKDGGIEVISNDPGLGVKSENKKRKLGIFIDSRIGNGKIEEIRWALEDLTRRGDLLGRFLENVVIHSETITETSLQFMQERKGVRPENMIIIAPDQDLKCLKPYEGVSVITKVNDKDLQEDAYYPLLEVVLFSLARAKVLNFTADELKKIYASIPNIDMRVLSAEEMIRLCWDQNGNRCKEAGVIVIKLGIPNAEQLTCDSQVYMAIAKYIRENA